MKSGYQKVLNKNPSYTKKGPGRRHNHLTAKEQAAKDKMMTVGGLNASQALNVLGKI
jgi:hypothetical protein